MGDIYGLSLEKLENKEMTILNSYIIHFLDSILFLNIRCFQSWHLRSLLDWQYNGI
jgi:hypothetical protein